MTRKAGVNGSAHTAQQRDRSLSEVRALLRDLRGTHNAPPRLYVPVGLTISPDLAISLYREARDDARRKDRQATEQARFLEVSDRINAKIAIHDKGGRPKRRGINVERDCNE